MSIEQLKIELRHLSQVQAKYRRDEKHAFRIYEPAIRRQLRILNLALLFLTNKPYHKAETTTKFMIERDFNLLVAKINEYTDKRVYAIDVRHFFMCPNDRLNIWLDRLRREARLAKLPWYEPTITESAIEFNRDHNGQLLLADVMRLCLKVSGDKVVPFVYYNSYASIEDVYTNQPLTLNTMKQMHHLDLYVEELVRRESRLTFFQRFLRHMKGELVTPLVG